MQKKHNSIINALGFLFCIKIWVSYYIYPTGEDMVFRFPLMNMAKLSGKKSTTAAQWLGKYF